MSAVPSLDSRAASVAQGRGDAGPGHNNAIHPKDLDAAKAILRRSRGHRLSKRAHREVLGSERWGELLRSLGDTAEERRVEWPAQWVRRHATRDQAEAEIMTRALTAAEVIIALTPDDPEAEDEEPKPFRLKVLGASEFAATEFRMEWLVRRIFVADQPCVVAAPKKGLKTTTMVDLWVSLASGTHFLGTFEVPNAVPVLMLSGESGGFVIKDTVQRVCRSKGIDMEDLEGNLFVGFDLPQLSIEEQVDVLADVIRENGIKVVIIDPLYLCLLSGGNRRLEASNLFDMGPLLSGIARKCLDAGATPILVHHFKKNLTDPYELPELENMSFAGVQEFARQWIMLGRREKFEPGSGLHKLWLTVGGSAGHSGEWAIDIAEGVMGDDFRGREWNVSVKLASEARLEVSEQTKATRAAKETEKIRARDEVKIRQQCDDAETALDTLRRIGPATKTTWRDSLGWNSARMGSALARLTESGRIRPAEVLIPNRSGGRIVEGWEVNPDAKTDLSAAMAEDRS